MLYGWMDGWMDGWVDSIIPTFQHFYIQTFNAKLPNQLPIISNMRGILILLLTLVLYSSCVKEVTIDLPSKESKVVVNALMDFNAPPTIHVSLSSPINGSANQTINDATVIVFEDGIPIDSLHEGSLGIYQFERIRPKQNSTYRVRVITQSHGITDGEVKIPVAPDIRITSITTQTNLMGSDSSNLNTGCFFIHQ
jgi:hypothetical protein